MDPTSNVQPFVACQDGSYCYPTSGGSTDCAGNAGSGFDGDSCTGYADCAAGFVCVDSAGGSKYCRQWCRVGWDDCPGTSCGSFGPPLYVGTVEYGYCP
jgi:hypothetical protein